MLLLRPTAALILATAAPAQADTLELGGYVGGTSSRTLTTEPDGSESQPGHREYGGTFGIHARYPLTSAILLEGDLLFTQKGANSGDHLTFYYAEAPWLIRVDTFRPWSSARVFADVGLAPALRLLCTDSPLWFGFDFHSCSDDRKPSLFDVDVVVGGGVGTSTFEVQLRYERGLIDIDEHGGKTINRTWFLMVGFGKTVDVAW